MIDSYESISPTAILTAYPRMFTDIPYEKEIYKWLSKNCNENVKLNKLLAPEIEARYKLTNKLFEDTGIEQVLELAAGYCSRGLIYSKKGIRYVEMDLESVSNNKINLLNDIDSINSNLNIITGNALNFDDVIKCEDFFDINKEIAVINEGLFRYLTFDEKKKVAINIYNLLKKYNGVWITCDVTPKKFLQKQDNSNKGLNENINVITSRNTLNDRFEDINHIKSFFRDIGFKSIEIHKFIEMKEELKSFDILNIDRNSFDELLENGIVAVMKI